MRLVRRIAGCDMRLVRGRWKWQVTLFYADNVKPPRKPGELAIQTVHTTDSSKDMEVAAGKSRSDIGRIEIIRIDAPPD